MKRIYYLFLYAELSPEEMRVISLMVQGYTADQIAIKLDKSIKTVNNQLNSVYNKLNIHFSHQVILIASLEGFDPKGFYKGENLFESITLKPLPKGTDKSIADLIAMRYKQGIQQNGQKNNR